MPERPAPADVPAPVVDTVLRGHALFSDQGSAGLCGVYLVEQGPRRILFDCGHTGRRKALHRALARRGLSTDDVDTLVLSHTHWDHMQNADLFPHAEILVHPEELARLGEESAHDPAAPPWSAAVLRGLAVRPVTDGREIAPGVTVVGLPGHTPGSIGLAVDTGAGTALLSGDAVSSAKALRARCCTVVTTGQAAAARTMERVRSTAAFVYPGHDRPFTVVDGAPGRYLLPRADMASAPPDPLTAEP
ncbi:MBL fold metallo-hydrolase [Streptomyces sp. AD681]|uniref:MBL fold metallo-hydrolase n=1 Tax=Streptomyces sp. AD681 TaxID=3019069 RepID=UPI0022F1A160|nr:MBL fold metallo-hydrolase [Streptomyces sp. AD681]MDA5145668.1 MBL fold metallo-hydrolase [Streptomyces sp. AD681]